MIVPVKIFRVNPKAKIPEYATAGSVAVDVQVMEDLFLLPQMSARVPSGIAIAVPSGYEAQLRPRSSASGKGLLVNLGTVDSDYRGELMLNVTNVGNESFQANAFERIGQLLVLPVPRIVFAEVASQEELGATARGTGGFGSTGR